jgi:hypothetical protein
MVSEDMQHVVVLRNIYYIGEISVATKAREMKQFNPRLFISVFLHKPNIYKSVGPLFSRNLKHAQTFPHHIQSETFEGK